MSIRVDAWLISGRCSPYLEINQTGMDLVAYSCSQHAGSAILYVNMPHNWIYMEFSCQHAIILYYYDHIHIMLTGTYNYLSRT